MKMVHILCFNTADIFGTEDVLDTEHFFDTENIEEFAVWDVSS